MRRSWTWPDSPASGSTAWPATSAARSRQWTGIPVSVGIGPTKTLAKAANHLAKKDPAAAGVWLIATEQARRDALARLAVGDVWGIGRRWAAFLEGHGIGTALAFSEQPDRWIRTHLNVVGPAHRRRAPRHALHPAGAGPAARGKGCASRACSAAS